MEKQNELKVFEDKKVRTIWDVDQEKWFLSVVDVIAVLTESPNPRKYWSVLKTRLKAEGSQLATNCSQLKMKSADGKNYLTIISNEQWKKKTLLQVKVRSLPSGLFVCINFLQRKKKNLY